ncbi:MAG: hypothetical protein HPY74_09485 [Firmicutes bacterium]|nr:hypothetical protein [Bacillota bacterium]
MKATRHDYSKRNYLPYIPLITKKDENRIEDKLDDKTCEETPVNIEDTICREMADTGTTESTDIDGSAAGEIVSAANECTIDDGNKVVTNTDDTADEKDKEKENKNIVAKNADEQVDDNIQRGKQPVLRESVPPKRKGLRPRMSEFKYIRPIENEEYFNTQNFVNQKKNEQTRIRITPEGCFINDEPYDPQNPPYGMKIFVDNKNARSEDYKK